jgi:hypothetical protein
LRFELRRIVAQALSFACPRRRLRTLITDRSLAGVTSMVQERAVQLCERNWNF